MATRNSKKKCQKTVDVTLTGHFFFINQISLPEIFANVAVKMPGIERISSITSGGASESTFSTMIASSPGLIRPTCMPAILMLHRLRIVDALPITPGPA